MSDANWWANKLNGNTPQAPSRSNNLVPMPPSQMPMAPMPTFQAQPTVRAQSAYQNTACPDCGSSNYMSPSPQVAFRCYDCGYPVQQSGSRYGSLAGAHTDGAAKQSLGNDATNNWNPQGIIGRVS